MDKNQDFLELLGLFMGLVESQAGKTIPPGEVWRNDAQALSLKLFHHLVSLKNIVDGATISHGPATFEFVDHASAKVVARAALETYLVFFHIYGCSPLSRGVFRHKAWTLAGLLDRQKFKPITKEGIERQQEERKTIEKLLPELEGDPELSSYSEKQQKRLLEGNWRPGKSWNDLGLDAGFNRKYLTEVYSYLCGYSHSSYISVLQVRQALTIEDQRMLAGTSVDVANSILGHFILLYPSIFSGAKDVLVREAGRKQIAELWHYRSSASSEEKR